MDDEDGIELSLGLSCGGSSSKSKAKDVSLDPTCGEGNRNKAIGENLCVSEASLKPFLPMSIEKMDQNGGQRRNDLVKHPHESFWTDLGQQVSVDTDNHRFPGLWTSNKTLDVDADQSGLHKRKLSFSDVNLLKKQEKGNDLGDVTFRNHVSLPTEDGYSGENEDVAESKAEGSTSWLASQGEEKSRVLVMQKGYEERFLAEQAHGGSQAVKQSNPSGHSSNADRGKLSYGVPLALQSLGPTTSLYQASSKAQNILAASNAPAFASLGVMQLMPLRNNEQSTLQPIGSTNLQHTFGYSPVQLPTLETNSSWVFGPSQHLAPHGNRVVEDGVTDTEHKEKANISQVQVSKSPRQTMIYVGKIADVGKSSGKQVEETDTTSSPTRAEEESRGSKPSFRQKEAVVKPTIVEGSPQEGSAIKPGIAPAIKFGGSGSYPDLPWVSTTGPGPNGRTISGVTYKYSINQIKIVCACHGSHMTPEEFVQHASEGGGDALDNDIGVAAFPSSSSAAASAPG